MIRKFYFKVPVFFSEIIKIKFLFSLLLLSFCFITALLLSVVINIGKMCLMREIKKESYKENTKDDNMI